MREGLNVTKWRHGGTVDLAYSLIPAPINVAEFLGYRPAPPTTKRLRQVLCTYVLFWMLVLVAAVAASSPASAASVADDCANLGRGAKIGSSTILVAKMVTNGTFPDSQYGEHKGLPQFCRVLAVAQPHPGSNVVIEMWLPTAAEWNGKMLGTGNGGAAGKIQTIALAGGVRRGFAVVNTDLGSYPAASPDVGFRFGDGRPEAVRDWAYRATHEMTVLGKELVRRFYGRPASRAYYSGCSTGGHQGLTEVQRYPEDYDAMLVAAPGHNRTHLHTRFAALRQLGLQPGAQISTEQFKLWTDFLTKQCAGKDGGAPGDKFLTNPLACQISPRRMACKPGQAPETCFSPVQVAALEAIYRGTRNPRTGELIYFADVRGAESDLSRVYGDTEYTRNFDLAHWYLPPDRTTESFDFDHDMEGMDDMLAKDINAMDPDLTKFVAHGGKLILVHGWQDGLISPLDTIDYYQHVKADGRAKDEYARLFLVPAMSHCWGGTEGPGAVGQWTPMVPLGSADHDLLLALDRWSTTGVAPDVVIGSQLKNLDALIGHGDIDAKPIATRPVCAFPRSAKYDGKGDPSVASSFSCAMTGKMTYEEPAQKYLR